MSRARVGCTLALVAAAAACGGESGGQRLGVEGASCLRTADCEAPLQCVGNLCVGPASGDGTSLPDHPFGLDVRYGDPAPEADMASPGEAVDEVGPDEDRGSWPPEYGPLPDIGIDLGPVEASAPEVQVVVPDAYGECETLGVAPSWNGTFQGSVIYDLKGKGAAFGVADQDTLEVSGSLAFEIKCLEKKLTVVGSMSGIATSPTQYGSNPFAIKIGGSYNTKTRTITALLLEGEVKLWGIIGVYFEGQLSGTLEPVGDFLGEWNGTETGNALNWDVDAYGFGTWEAWPDVP